MTTQERDDHPDADERPGGAQDQGQPSSSDLDDQGGTSFDYIDEAIEESMIASDPPAWTPQTGIGTPGRDAGRGQARRD